MVRLCIVMFVQSSTLLLSSVKENEKYSTCMFAFVCKPTDKAKVEYLAYLESDNPKHVAQRNQEIVLMGFKEQTCISMNIRLEGKTLKGRNRIHEHGEWWKLIKTSNFVLFSNQKGPWILVESVKHPKHNRWVHTSMDTDFKVIVE